MNPSRASDRPLDGNMALLADHALALAAIRRSGFEAGDHVAVFGLNPAGLAAVRLARHLRAGRIDCIDDARESFDDSRPQGVRHSNGTDYGRWARANSEDLPRRLLLFASSPGLLELAVNAAGRRGVIVVAGGAAPEHVSIPNYYLNMIMKETAIVGLRAPTPAEQQEAEELLRSGSTT